MTNLKYNKGVIEDILLSPAVQAYVDRVGRAMAQAAGPGYAYKTETRAEQRSRGAIFPETYAAHQDNIKNLTLSRVLVSYKA